jgi:trigger factor
MQVTETQRDGLRHEYRVTLGADDMQARLSHRLDELRHSARLPGFRPGKVPAQLLRKRYAKSLWTEVLQEAVTTSTEAAIRERSLRLAMQPKVELGDYEEGGSLEYTLSVELIPDFDPADFGKIKVARQVAEPSGKDVDEAVQRLADAQRSFVDAVEGHVAEKGDLLTIGFVGRIDGDEFEGGKGENAQVEIGGGGFIPGFDEQLAGAAAGDRRDVTVTFPADHGTAHLAGRQAVFDCTVAAVQVPEKVPPDEALAKRLGLESLDKVRAAVVDQLKKDYALISRRKLKRDLLDELARLHDFDVPPGLVDSEVDAIRKADDARTGEAGAAGEGGESEKTGEERGDNKVRDMAVRRVRLGLLLSEIGRRNNIEASREEMERAMRQQALRYPGQEQEVLKYLRSNKEAEDQLRGPIIEDKVVDFILELAKVEERKVTRDELLDESASPTAPGSAAATPKDASPADDRATP